MPNAPNSLRPLPRLSEIGVDLNGNLVVPGTMVFPADDAGLFPRMETGHLRISRLWGLHLAPCQVVREASGFILPSEVGSELSMPGQFSDLIASMAKYGQEGRTETRLPGQGGELRSGARNEAKHSQPLSDWSLVVEITEDWMKVSLSAKLHAETIVGLDGNFWSAQEGATIELAFEIDPATRLACFEKRSDANSHGAELVEAPTKSNLKSLNLSNAMIGADGSVLGISGNRWVCISWGAAPADFTDFSYYQSAFRTNQEFVKLKDRTKPHISITCISIDFIHKIVRESTSADLEFHNGSFGILSYGGGSGSKWEVIRDLCLSIKLDDGGLHFSYIAYASYELTSQRSRIKGEFSILWEVLILRFPMIAQLRKRVEGLASTNDGGGTGREPAVHHKDVGETGGPTRPGAPSSLFRRLFPR